MTPPPVPKFQIKQINISQEPEFYAQVLELRNEELRKKIGLSIYDEDLSEEVNYIVLAAVATPSFTETTVVGCVVLVRQDEKTFRLRQMAVHAAHQGKNIGRLLMEAAEVVVKDNLCSRIYLHARTVSKGFYAKLGYSTISDEFIELNIPHYEMEKHL